MLFIDCQGGALRMTALAVGNATVRVYRRVKATLNYAVQVR